MGCGAGADGGAKSTGLKTGHHLREKQIQGDVSWLGGQRETEDGVRCECARGSACSGGGLVCAECSWSCGIGAGGGHATGTRAGGIRCSGLARVGRGEDGESEDRGGADFYRQKGKWKMDGGVWHVERG